MGGRTYPVRYYPVAIRLRDRNSTPHQFAKLVGDPVGRAILCIALFPQSGDSSGAILGVRSVALLHVYPTYMLCNWQQKDKGLPYATIITLSHYNIKKRVETLFFTNKAIFYRNRSAARTRASSFNMRRVAIIVNTTFTNGMADHIVRYHSQLTVDSWQLTVDSWQLTAPKGS